MVFVLKVLCIADVCNPKDYLNTKCSIIIINQNGDKVTAIVKDKITVEYKTKSVRLLIDGYFTK